MRSAVVRELAVVGEAINAALRDEPSLIEGIPTLREWVGLRHIIAHAYGCASFLKSNLIPVGVGLSIDTLLIAIGKLVSEELLVQASVCASESQQAFMGTLLAKLAPFDDQDTVYFFDC